MGPEHNLQTWRCNSGNVTWDSLIISYPAPLKYASSLEWENVLCMGQLSLGEAISSKKVCCPPTCNLHPKSITIIVWGFLFPIEYTGSRIKERPHLRPSHSMTHLGNLYFPSVTSHFCELSQFRSSSSQKRKKLLLSDTARVPLIFKPQLWLITLSFLCQETVDKRGHHPGTSNWPI